jgi:hypothetical protein
LAISFALPAFAQQKEAVDPQIIEQLDALGKKFDEAWNNNVAVAVAAFFMEEAVLVNDSGPVSNIQSAGIDLLQCLIINYDLADNKEGVGKRRSSTLIVGL